MAREKRIACINDISCFGKCSLTVALPVISSMGVEAAVLPTAILSTHTGGFEGYTKLDMTDELERIITHWKKIGLTFDGIYTGYFANISQVETAIKFIDDFKGENTFVVVDPVMADNGKLYDGFDEGFANSLLKLAKKADIITPNITEALLMAGMDYSCPQSEKLLGECEESLNSLGISRIAFTGVETGEGKIGYRFSSSEERFMLEFEKREGIFHGCGDVFASVLSGRLACGDGYSEAVKKAALFAEKCVAATVDDSKIKKYGLRFEKCINDAERD